MGDKFFHTFVILAYKTSEFLEECIKSTLNQSIRTNVVIATSTPNSYISDLANKYNLKIVINKQHIGIGQDFDFASNCVNSELVTIAHQDDIYDFNYVKNISQNYTKYPSSIILFSDYFEIRNNKIVNKNLNLLIKRFLLFPLKNHYLSNFTFVKRLVLRFGNPICCPAVTFVTRNCPKQKFSSQLKCNVDWFAWEQLSYLKGSFTYIPKKLMGHRISNESTTTEIIKENIRTNEDLDILCKFWPRWIAKIINFFYKNAEKSNNINN